MAATLAARNTLQVTTLLPMSTAWITLIIAGLLEVGWAIGLKYSDGFNFRTKPLATALTLAAMIVSMYLLAQSVRTIPVGTGYAIWTGIGALGAATLGIILFQEPATMARIVCLLMLVAGIVGLKLTTPMAKGSLMQQPIDVYISGYGKGVTRAKFDPATGALSEPVLVAEVAKASFVAAHPSLPILYSVSETGGGSVVALRRGDDGAYQSVSQQSSGGNGPCHVSVHPNGKAAFVANYGDGRVSLLPLKEDGTFGDAISTHQHVGSGPNTKRQEHAHAHSIYTHPNGRHVLSADLGCDQLFIYTPDLEKGIFGEPRLSPTNPGAGPRHLAVSEDGRFVYAVTELSNTVEVYAWTDDGPLTRIQTVSTLPDNFSGTSSCAEIRLHPSGRYLYASNRGHNSVAAFQVDPQAGTLTSQGTTPTEGDHPRGFEISPDGNYLLVANQKSDVVRVWKLDPETGKLGKAVSQTMLEKPACVRFIESRP